MPSLLPEIAAPQRRATTARAARSTENEPERFSSHLTDSTQRRATTRQQPEQREPTAQRPAPSDQGHGAADRRADRPQTNAAKDRPEPHAAARVDDRASDQARINREPDAAKPNGSDDAAAEPDTGTTASIAESSAAQMATDATLTLEVAIGAGAADDSDADADEAGDKNDSAAASAAGAPVPLAISVATDVIADTGQAPAPTGDAEFAVAAAGSRAATPASTSIPGESADRSLTSMDNDAMRSEPGIFAAPPSAPAVTAGKPEHSPHRHGTHEDSQPVLTAVQGNVTPADMTAGPKPHEPHGHGLHFQLQPVSDLAAQTAPQAALPAKAPDAVPVQAVPIAIGLKALDGAREFEIRLDPAELGRVDVKLSISEDGRVQASLVVDRVETLALLQRDARTLERAFDQAGLTAEANSIQFSLRQDSSDGQRNARESFDESGAASRQPDIAQPVQAIERPAQLYRGFVRETAVDIRV